MHRTLNTRQIPSHVAVEIRTILQNQSKIESDDPLLSDDTSELTKKGISVLATATDLPDDDPLGAALVADRSYYLDLLNPELLTPSESICAGERLVRVDTRFVAGLIRAADESPDVGFVMRALELIERLDQSGAAAQWIRRQTGHSDVNIRSKAVKILAKLHANLSVIEKQLDSADARVRANALEGMWGGNSARHRQLLDRAARDPDHRVATNGLYGLYLAHAPGITERMARVAQSPSPQERAAVAWAMGRTGDSKFADELNRLAADPEACVRDSAVRALAGLREAENANSSE